MSKLLSKSDFNKQAAELLIDNGLFSPSVHCSFYHCIQFMKHIALDKWGMSESDIAGEMNRSNTRSTHKYLIRLMMEKIRLVNKGAIVAFKAQIGGLKKLREASDYSDEQIDMGKSMEALDTSRKVKQCLIDNLV